jgi:hypothetical protein
MQAVVRLEYVTTRVGSGGPLGNLVKQMKWGTNLKYQPDSQAQV